MEVPTWALAIGIAGSAGFVAYLQQFAADDKDPPWRWKVMLAKVFTAAFVGLITYFLIAAKEKEIGRGITSFLYAVAGWGGPDTMRFFVEISRAILTRAASLASGSDEPKRTGDP